MHDSPFHYEEEEGYEVWGTILDVQPKVASVASHVALLIEKEKDTVKC